MSRTLLLDYLMSSSGKLGYDFPMKFEPGDEGRNNIQYDALKII